MKRPTIMLAIFAALSFAPLAALSQTPHPASPQKTGEIEVQVNDCGGNAGLLVDIAVTSE